MDQSLINPEIINREAEGLKQTDLQVFIIIVIIYIYIYTPNPARQNKRPVTLGREQRHDCCDESCTIKPRLPRLSVDFPPGHISHFTTDKEGYDIYPGGSFVC